MADKLQGAIDLLNETHGPGYGNVVHSMTALIASAHMRHDPIDLYACQVLASYFGIEAKWLLHVINAQAADLGQKPLLNQEFPGWSQP